MLKSATVKRWSSATASRIPRSVITANLTASVSSVQQRQHLFLGRVLGDQSHGHHGLGPKRERGIEGSMLTAYRESSANGRLDRHPVRRASREQPSKTGRRSRSPPAARWRAPGARTRPGTSVPRMCRISVQLSSIRYRRRRAPVPPGAPAEGWRGRSTPTSRLRRPTTPRARPPRPRRGWGGGSARA